MFLYVSAAVGLAQKGKEIKKGDTIDFIYVNAKHHNETLLQELKEEIKFEK